MRQMTMVGFLQAQNCTTLASAWRHPEARTDFTTAAYYQHIGQVKSERASGWRQALARVVQFWACRKPTIVIWRMRSLRLSLPASIRRDAAAGQPPGQARMHDIGA